jgi:hypothetical protein
MKKFLIALGLITMMAGAVWADRAWNNMRVNARTTQFNAEVDNLFTALQKYKDQIGTFPSGGNLEVAKALQGHNQKNVIVIIGSKNSVRVNDRGEFLDPWGTPLRIYFSDTGILIRSAGPNRRFDDSRTIDSDDYYWSN